jgi:hypothetical protein
MEEMDTEDTFDIGYNRQEKNKNPKVVATVSTLVYWRQFIKDILPESSQGIVVVFENTCTASFTYEIKYVYYHTNWIWNFPWKHVNSFLEN